MVKCNIIKKNARGIFLIMLMIREAIAGRRMRSTLKVENLSTSDEFLVKFVNDNTPRRQSCRGKFIKQIISHPGCTSKPIVNKMCYGMCKSAYVPEIKNEKPEGSTCVQCQPATMHWMTVKLECPGSKQKLVLKKVRKIRKCHCWSDQVKMPYLMIPDSKSVMKVISWLKGFR